MAVQFVVLLSGQQTSVDGRAFSSSVAVMSCHAPGFRCGSRIPGQKGGWGAVGPVSTIACKPLSGPLSLARLRCQTNACCAFQSYPQAVTVTTPTHMAGLYVVATMNKEDVVVVRVPFSSL